MSYSKLLVLLFGMVVLITSSLAEYNEKPKPPTPSPIYKPPAPIKKPSPPIVPKPKPPTPSPIYKPSAPIKKPSPPVYNKPSPPIVPKPKPPTQPPRVVRPPPSSPYGKPPSLSLLLYMHRRLRR
ncbi:gibberellin-regulated protein 14 [Prunus yedoensis var. nudiflora]|uniref:Gibberellin-regulated protein 14 n=1 Tax=Prunus yedoensis var. nudiflora TaxID=2094558 RepID=A0A314Y1Z0_PRUYE|nr:gibberellin-regulated protein 14 [Prunus yedoensis var. nudiflora]